MTSRQVSPATIATKKIDTGISLSIIIYLEGLAHCLIGLAPSSQKMHMVVDRI
jgi:hypothetical protein